ncbi:MAG TPA: response regulator transcription factor [Sphingomonas sp.]|nr:response regulator transcription factor [Sphingomonas sp.]
MPDTVNVALLGRNSIVREGLRRILTEENFHVVQSVDQADNLDGARIDEPPPVLIVVDSGADQDDLDNVRMLQRRFPEARLVLLSDSFDFDAMVRAFRIGIHGYIVKEISCKQLVGSLQLVAMGEKVMPSKLADALPAHATFFEAPDTRKTLDGAALSDRELEILRCLIMGCPNKIISRRLEISEATVKVHVKAILRKLRVQNRTQAAIWGVNRGVEGFAYDAPAAAAAAQPAMIAA